MTTLSIYDKIILMVPKSKNIEK